MILLLLALMIVHLAMSVIHPCIWTQSSKCVVMFPPCSAHAVCHTIMLKNTFLPNSSYMPASSFTTDAVGLPIVLSATSIPAKAKINCLGRQGNRKVQTAADHTHGTRSRSRPTTLTDSKRKALNPYRNTRDFTIKKVRFQDANTDDSDVIHQLWGLQVSPIATAPTMLHTQTDNSADGVLLDMEEKDGDVRNDEHTSQLTTTLAAQLKGIEKFFIVHSDPPSTPPTQVVETNLDTREVTEPQATTEIVSTDDTIHDTNINVVLDVMDTSQSNGNTPIVVNTATTPDQTSPASNNQATAEAVTTVTDMSASTNETNQTTTQPPPVDSDTRAQDNLLDPDESDMVITTNTYLTSPPPTHYTATTATEPELPTLLSAASFTPDQLTEVDLPLLPNTTQSQEILNPEDVMAVDNEDVSGAPTVLPTTPTHSQSHTDTTSDAVTPSDITTSHLSITPPSPQATIPLPTTSASPPQAVPKKDHAETLAANYVEPPGLGDSQVVPYKLIKSLVVKLTGLSQVVEGYPGIESMLTIFGHSSHPDPKLKRDISSLFLDPRDYPPHPSHAVFKTLRSWSKACQVTFLLRNNIFMSHLQVYHSAATTLRASMIQNHKQFCDREIQQLPALYELLKEEFPRLQHPGLTAGAVYGRIHKDFLHKIGKQYKLIKEDLFLLAKLFPSFEFCPTPPGANMQHLHNHLRLLCDESIALSEVGLHVALPAPETDPDNFSAEARQMRRTLAATPSLLPAARKTWSAIATGTHVRSQVPPQATTEATETQLLAVRTQLKSYSDVSAAYEVSPEISLSQQTRTLIALKADLGERFLVTNMVLIDRFPISKGIAAAIRARRLTQEQQAYIVQTARAAITQLGFPTRKHITNPPKNVLEIDEYYLRSVIYDSIIPNTVPGFYSFGVKLSHVATFTVAPIHKLELKVLTFPMIQRIHVRDADNTMRTAITQALDTTPGDYIAFCSFGARTVAVVRNVPQPLSPTDGGIRDADGLDSSSSTAACLLTVENMLNPGPTDPTCSGTYVLIATAFVDHGQPTGDRPQKTPEVFLTIRSRPPRQGHPDPDILLLQQQQQTFAINTTAGPAVMLFNGFTLELFNCASIAYDCFQTTNSLIPARPRRHPATSVSLATSIFSGLLYHLSTSDFLTAFALDPLNTPLLQSIGGCFPIRPPYSPKKDPVQEPATFCILWKHGQCPASVSVTALQIFSSPVVRGDRKVTVSHASLPGMSPFDTYTPFLTNTNDLFSQEYEAQPRTVVDPRETTVLATPTTHSPSNTTAAAVVRPAPGVDSNPAPTLANPTSSTTSLTTASSSDSQRILEVLTRQQAQLGAMASFMARSALSSTINQIFLVQDLLQKAQEELANIVDTYGENSTECLTDRARVEAISTKLQELEADRDALIDPSLMLK